MISHATESCGVCGAVAPPGRRGRYCVGCGTRVRGLSVAVHPPVVYAGPETRARLSVSITNAGQMSVKIAEVALVDHAGGREVQPLPFDGVLPGRGHMEQVVELEPSVAVGRYELELVTVGGLSARAAIVVQAVPELTVEAASQQHGLPHVVLEGEIDAELVDEPPRQWTGACIGRLRATGTVTVTEAFALVADRRIPVLTGRTELSSGDPIPVQISVDEVLARAAADAPLTCTLSVAIAGLEEPLETPFQLARLRSARLSVDRQELQRAVFKAGQTTQILTHGLSKSFDAVVALRNNGELAVGVAGMIVTDAPELVRVLNASELNERPLPQQNLQRQIEGLRVRLRVNVDAVPYDNLPLSGDSGTRSLDVQLKVPLKSLEDGETRAWTGSEHLVTLTFRQAEDMAGWLFLDLGTTNTCFAIAEDGSDKPRLLDVDPEDALGDVYPSLVYHHNHRQISAGHDLDGSRFGALMREQMYVDLQTMLGTAVEFKPDIASDRPGHYTDNYGLTRVRTAREVARTFLAHCFRELTRLHLSGMPRAVILSAPVDWNKSARRLLSGLVQDTLATQGWPNREVDVLASEPEALLGALLCAPDGGRSLAIGAAERIAVFDFGGGTTDVIGVDVVRRGDEVYSAKYVRDCRFMYGQGGEELTRQIAAKLWPKVRERLDEQRGEALKKAAYKALLDEFRPPTSKEAVVGMKEPQQQLYRGLLQVAEAAKVSYDELRKAGGKKRKEGPGANAYVFDVKPEGADAVRINLTMGQVFDEDRINEVIDSFVRPMLGALHEREVRLAHGGGAPFDVIFLAGNSSRLRRVHELAGEIFGDKRVHFAGDKYAKEGVVLGLGYMMLNNVMIDPEDEDEPTPPCGFQIGATAYHAGVPAEIRCRRALTVVARPFDSLGSRLDFERVLATFRVGDVVNGRWENLQLELRATELGSELECLLIVREPTAAGGWRERAVLEPR